jgi:hypothetical protein
LEQAGRRDPIAALARGISNRASQKSIDKAREKTAKGKTQGMDALEGGLKWVGFIAAFRIYSVC